MSIACSIRLMGESAIVKCATCGRKTEFFAEPVGPICSNRCQMIELGKMAERGMQNYRAAAKLIIPWNTKNTRARCSTGWRRA